MTSVNSESTTKTVQLICEKKEIRIARNISEELSHEGYSVVISNASKDEKDIIGPDIVLLLLGEKIGSNDNFLSVIDSAEQAKIPIITVQTVKKELPDELSHRLYVNQALILNDYKTYGEFFKALNPALSGSAVPQKQSAPTKDKKICILTKKNRSVLLSAAIAVGVILLAIAVAFLFFWKKIPPVAGLLTDDAIQQIEDAGFKTSVISRYEEGVEYGIVIKTNRGNYGFTFIPVVISESLGSSSELLEMPNTVGMHISNGTERLLQDGFKKITIAMAEKSGDKTAYICRQNIPAGIKVSAKNHIYLDIGHSDVPVSFVIDGVEYTVSVGRPAVIDNSKTTSPETETPETTPPETETPETTPPGTETPETAPSETETPETTPSETETPETTPSENPITSLYIYGNTVSDAKRNVETVRNSVEKGIIDTDIMFLDGKTQIKNTTTVPEIPKTVKELSLYAVSLKDLSCLAGCNDLEYLSLSGSQIDDLSQLSKLPKLKELVVCDEPESADYATLLSSKSLKTVYVTSGDAYHKIYSLGTLPFTLKYSDDLTVVTTYAQLKNAFSSKTSGEILFTSETGDYDTPDYSSCNTVTVPAGEELVLKSGCHFTSMRCQINNYGTIRICGDWSCGMFGLENYGTVIIEKNGIYSGGMGETTNYGTFKVEKGGLFILQRGQRFICTGGSTFINNGVVINNFGGSFEFWEGSDPIVNNTVFYYDYDAIRTNFGDGAIMDMNKVSGSGTVVQFDEQEAIAEIRKQRQ